MMYIHICCGIERESHILMLDDGFVRVADVLERIREVKSVRYATLLLLNQKGEVLNNSYCIHKARYYRVIRRPSS